MYAAGGEHSLREPCHQILGLVAEASWLFVTDSEALEELIHRYLSIGAWARGREVLSAFANLLDGRIEPVFAHDILLAGSMADEGGRVDARDLVHAAVMRRIGVDHIISADRGHQPS